MTEISSQDVLERLERYHDGLQRMKMYYGRMARIYRLDGDRYIGRSARHMTNWFGNYLSCVRRDTHLAWVIKEPYLLNVNISEEVDGFILAFENIFGRIAELADLSVEFAKAEGYIRSAIEKLEAHLQITQNQENSGYEQEMDPYLEMQLRNLLDGI